MSTHNVIEKMERDLSIAYERGKTWLPVSTEDMETLLQMLKMYCWGVAKGDTATVSRKNNLELAMVMRGGEAFASIEGAHLANPSTVAESVKAMLDDLSVAVRAMVERMERVIDV